MSNEIQIFSNPQFGEIRTAINESNEPMFCASDVCNALGYCNSRDAVSRHVDEGDVAKRDTPTKSGIQAMTYVNESGLYSLIFGSKLESARQFKKWVTSDILPSIRKHGGYLTPQKIEDALLNPDVLIRLATDLKEERQKRLEAERAKMIAEKTNAENAPKVMFADAIIASNTSCLVGELAKILTQNGYKIGQNRLFRWLRENDYLGKHGERRNIPNQQYVEQGLFELKKGVHSGNDGVMRTTVTPKVTTKGQQYFINKFLSL